MPWGRASVLVDTADGSDDGCEWRAKTLPYRLAIEDAVPDGIKRICCEQLVEPRIRPTVGMTQCKVSP